MFIMAPLLSLLMNSNAVYFGSKRLCSGLPSLSSSSWKHSASYICDLTTTHIRITLERLRTHMSDIIPGESDKSSAGRV